jgi:hypothetical protein
MHPCSPDPYVRTGRPTQLLYDPLSPPPTHDPSVSPLPVRPQLTLGKTSTSAFVEAFRLANLGPLLKQLSTLSSSAKPIASGSSSPHKLQMHTAYTTAGQAFDSLLRESGETQEALREAGAQVGAFRLSAEREVRAVGIDDMQPEGLEDARRHVLELLAQKFAWWTLAWRMDDVGTELKGEVERSYLTEFERQVEATIPPPDPVCMVVADDLIDSLY